MALRILSNSILNDLRCRPMQWNFFVVLLACYFSFAEIISDYKWTFGLILVSIVLTSILSTVTFQWLVPKGRTILITGCDSGFGFEMANTFSAMGMEVIATVMFPQGEAAELLRRSKVHVIQMDVTKDQDVNRCFEEVEKIVGEKGLWALVNNAGVGMFSEVELCPLELTKKLIEVNLTGVIHLTQKMLRLVRRGDEGRLVFISSIAGDVPTPLGAVYSASKSGVTSFAEILREEMKKWNVSVTVVKPVLAKTDFYRTQSVMLERHLDSVDKKVLAEYPSDYISTLKKTVLEDVGKNEIFPEYLESLFTTEKRHVVAAVKRALLDVNPPYEMDVGHFTTLLKILFNCCPTLAHFILATTTGFGKIIWFDMRRAKP